MACVVLYSIVNDIRGSPRPHRDPEPCVAFDGVAVYCCSPATEYIDPRSGSCDREPCHSNPSTSNPDAVPGCIRAIDGRVAATIQSDPIFSLWNLHILIAGAPHDNGIPRIGFVDCSLYRPGFLLIAINLLPAMGLLLRLSGDGRH